MVLRQVFWCAIFCFVCINLVSCQLSKGAACILKPKNVPGKCLELKDCPQALAGIKDQIYPQICSYSGTVPIVCCQQNANKPDGQLSSAKKPVGQLSREKCKEYGESVYKITYGHGIDRTKVKQSTCTIVQKTLIIGGTPADPKEFPHMALLGYGNPNDKQWQCGGTLISDQHILTAGHCLKSRFGDVKYIRLGDLDYKKTTDVAAPEDFNVAQIIKNPNYKPPSRYNDIALLKLDRKIAKFNEFIRPACLHTTSDIPKKRYLATGWGLTVIGADSGSDILLRVVLDSFSNQHCNESYESNISQRTLQYGIVPETQMCAGGTDTEKDTCQGDSGGPLQIYSDVHCMYDIVGVTSFGKTCGIAGIPGVYTRVSAFIDWIEKTVWP